MHDFTNPFYEERQSRIADALDNEALVGGTNLRCYDVYAEAVADAGDEGDEQEQDNAKESA